MECTQDGDRLVSLKAAKYKSLYRRINQLTSPACGSLEGCEVVRVLVGDEQRDYTLHKKLLSDSCAFFRDLIQEIPAPTSPQDGEEEEDSVLWLPNEAPDMFEIFVLWLYQQPRFLPFIHLSIQTMCPERLHILRTNLVRLHLFAAAIDLPAAQDAAMDALQDMYLHLDWDMAPDFVAFLYSDCGYQYAHRLRKWAVAMLAWTINGPGKAEALTGQVDKVFAAHPQLKADYNMHIQKMAMSRADVGIKNPQLRLPVNKLLSGERLFGFRQCTFHSHRATVGEGTCPHALALGHSPSAPLPGRKRDKEETASDTSDADQLIISPLRDLNEMSYLDLS